MPQPPKPDERPDGLEDPADPVAAVLKAADEPNRPRTRLERLNSALARLNMKAATMLAGLKPPREKDKN